MPQPHSKARAATDPDPNAIDPADMIDPDPSAPDPYPDDAAHQAAEEAYWTPEAMAQAVPDGPELGPGGSAVISDGDTASVGDDGNVVSGPAPGDGTPTGPGQSSLAPRRSASPGSGAKAFDLNGHARTVGTFFMDTGALVNGKTHCTGSVVHSPGRNLVLTAGHCGRGFEHARHVVFVPLYDAGKPCSGQPYGCFALKKIFVDPRYKKNTFTTSSNLDFALAVVESSRTSASGRHGRVEDMVGALTLKPTPGYVNDVQVPGYPGAGNPQHRQIRCLDRHADGTVNTRNPLKTGKLPGLHQMRMFCHGYTGGVSGSPWIANYDEEKGTGDVIGNVGGFNGGGDETNHDWVSYSPAYDGQIFHLRADAIRNKKLSTDCWYYTDCNAPNPGKDQRAYQAPADSPGTIGSASTWRHAKFLVSGDFTNESDDHSDLVVVWSDGEVTLYPSDGQGGFLDQRQLRSPKHPGTSWGRAVSITGGDFAGTNRSDIVISWPDGEVTLYTDVTASVAGSPGSFQLEPPSDHWKAAVQITAGRFRSPNHATDLVIRWFDGEMTMLTSVGDKKKLHELEGTANEVILRKADPHWKAMKLMAAGTLSGGQRWDLLAGWVDGELDSYPVSTGKIGAEGRLHTSTGPKDVWHANTSMAMGKFGSWSSTNGKYSDVVVHWIDGETTLYPGSSSTRLGSPARTLVYMGT